MLNFPTADPDDKELLKDSYDAIRSKDSVEIICNTDELDSIYRTLVNSISLPKIGVYTIANLFKINTGSGYFYIIQTLHDTGYYYSGKHLLEEYRYQVIGMARLKEDFGSIMVRPEEKADRIVGRFFKSEIELPNADEFNSKYYVAADLQDAAVRLLGTQTRGAISKLKSLHLTVKKDLLLV